MGKNRDNINWQPVSFLPQISNMIDGMLDAAKETYEPLRQIKVHDDFTIKRIFKVSGQQVEDEWMYDKQLEKWSNLPDLKTAQRDEIQRLKGVFRVLPAGLLAILKYMIYAGHNQLL